MDYDLIILGGGPAGLTAGIYAQRYNLQTILLTKDIGGQTALSGAIENYPGFDGKTGFELIQKIRSQFETLGGKVVEGITISKLSKDGNMFKVDTNATQNNSLTGKSIIISLGKRHRKLGLEGEDELVGKGLSYCVTCDGMFTKDKDVVIVGSGYSAAEGVLILAKIAKSITVISSADSFSGEPVTIEQVKKISGLKTIFNAKVTRIMSENGFIKEIEYEKDTQKSSINCQFIFVEIGYMPNTELFKEIINLNDKGEIIIDEKNATSLAGVFAAGDITNVLSKQSIIAAGEGAKAAIAANKYLQNTSK
ncbi:thioredoxin-disulfide reductase [Candidatus Berkelbacteria bacterium CG10_big_fil_rev_8_21_14_0_10_41_12]|uniref:Thioredoxin-disulfide reductase n=1 Tax=Candidatus Berkelbacteria bacterium CG10_big_fil_rev_8_21_14_0_10_41_12 TaxID=1974513 RepID=A0A2M6WWR4_9BACT|nr:MAG: thioredoxin-disulfide reductase [Candidatus Berkelbacteria bacterium CG10_big_fil_rev_8_21_14_0_10_41_12]